MPVQVYEHAMDWNAPGVEAVPIGLAAGRPGGYPWLDLRLTGREEAMTFPVVVLENGLVRIKVMPTLGGRIIEWHDKRTMKDVLPKVTGIEAVAGGARGVEVRQGIEFWLGPGERLNRMGTVDFLLRDPEDEEGPAAVFLHELDAPRGLGWTVCLTLYPDSAALTVDFKVQNRTLGVVAGCGGLQFWAGADLRPVPGSEGVFYDEARDTGFGVFCREGWVVSELVEPGVVRAWSPAARGGLGPRKVDEFKLRLVPLSGLGVCSAAGAGAAVGLTSAELRVLVPSVVQGGKTFLKTADGGTFESSGDLLPDVVSVSDLSGLPSAPVGVMVRSFEKDLLVSFDSTVSFVASGREMERVVSGVSESLEEVLATKFGRLFVGEAVDFWPLARVSGMESAAFLGMAMGAVRREDWGAADGFLERSLAFNADDALAWWLKAVVKRKGGIDAEGERLELMNAHFLSPLEPALRAEGFLSQPVSEFKEGNPITKPLADDPSAAIEVCCLLLEAGLVSEMARLADEVLRHREIAGVRYLLAWALLEHSRMEASAAEQVGLAGRTALEPPFPWREMEVRAVRGLAGRFGGDERLGVLGRLV